MTDYNRLAKDMESLQQLDIDWMQLEGKSILITGVTGLLGSMLCRTLSHYNLKQGWNIRIYAMARNASRAKDMLQDIADDSNLIFVEQDIEAEIHITDPVDYIVHTACPTKSNYFIEHPVETIRAIVNGTQNILEFAKRNKCQSAVYLSSMEAYGQVLHENILQPEEVGYINPLSLRSSYSEGKRIAETICVSYAKEYDIPVKIIRLAQTFGPGIPREDNRVFAQFLHSALAGEDIVMFTEGGSKRMYLDTMDAVKAVCAVLLRGKNGCVYNAANEDSYCSIREMAELVIQNFGTGHNGVRIDRSRNVGQYPPDNMLKLDVTPLKELGWKAQYSLPDMYQRMADDMKPEA